MARIIDFRELVETLNDIKDLIRPDIQKDHPAMKELFDTIAYNLMNDHEREVFERYYSEDNSLSSKHAFDRLGVDVGGDHHKKEEVEDTLFSGLMDEDQYDDFQKEKKDDPALTARKYFKSYVEPYASSHMKKLVSIFETFLEDKPAKKQVPFLSHEEFISMSPKDRMKNYDRAVKSMKKWNK